MYKVLVLVIFVYLFFRIFTRYILPWLLKYYIKKSMEKKFGDKWSNSNFNDKKTTINIKQNRKTSFKNKQEDNSEYVDFTEIKED